MVTFLIILGIVVVLGGIVALAVRSVFSMESPPLVQPSPSQTEALPDSQSATTEPESVETQPEVQYSVPETIPVEPPSAPVPTHQLRDPSLIPEGHRPPSGGDVAMKVVKGLAISQIPVVGIPLAIHYLSKGAGPGYGHGQMTGMDAGYAHIPGAEKRKAEEEAAKKMRVEISASGTISANGETVTIEQLEERLIALRSRGGKAIYSVAQGSEEIPQAAQVLERIYALGVSVTFTAASSPTETQP